MYDDDNKCQVSASTEQKQKNYLIGIPHLANEKLKCAA